MTDCDRHLLGAYHDGELSAEQRIAVERHVKDCPACGAELHALSKASNLFKDYAFDDLRSEERARLDAVIASAGDRPLLRLIYGLTVAAASVLIVSCAWLMELPDTTGTVAQHPAARRPEPWEQVATSLRPDPLSLIQDDPIRYADAAMADWMLASLTGKVQP